MRIALHPSLRLLASAIVLAATHLPAAATLVWNWTYSGTGIAASGSLTTGDSSDPAGYFSITGFTGQRNGVSITGLQPSGTAIPGNEPFHVDNLIRATGNQLSGDGIGFSLQDGTFANVFYASFLAVPGYLEFFSAPPFSSFGAEDSELGVGFQASIVTSSIPEPSGLSLLAIGLVALSILRVASAKGLLFQSASDSALRTGSLGLPEAARL